MNHAATLSLGNSELRMYQDADKLMDTKKDSRKDDVKQSRPVRLKKPTWKIRENNATSKSNKNKLPEIQIKQKSQLKETKRICNISPYVSDDEDEILLSLSLPKTLKKSALQIEKKEAFKDLQNYQKVINMLHWLHVQPLQIKNALRGEYKICLPNLSLRLSDSFRQVDPVTVTLLQRYLTPETYEQLLDLINKQRNIPLRCSVCNESDREEKCIVCESCCKYFHCQCLGINKIAADDDFFCSDKCNVLHSI